MRIEEDDYLAHYGILRRSGRYPWGSGGPENVPVNPDKRNKVFIDYVADLKSQGLSDTEIARGMGISILQLRAEKSIAKNQQKQAQIAMAQRLKDKGMSTSAIARRMEIPESTARTLLRPGEKDKTDVLQTTANMLKEQVAEKTYVDVGKGVENTIGVSSTKLETAVAMLRTEGYELHPIKVVQAGTGEFTNMKVLCPPGTTQKEAWLNRLNVQQVLSFSDDGGRNFYGLHPPIQLDPKRVDIRYAEDGGKEADGVIYVRPGVRDVSLGGKNYAQVRVQVGDSHYVKGMAIYKKDLPEGIDIQFNTNKSDTGNKFDAMKPVVDDPNNPFGSIVRQLVDNPGKPDETPYSAMNIVNEEGAWAEWSRTLSTQMLSKQSPKLAKTQLDMTYERRQRDYENIQALTNDTVRKKLLNDFADGTDSAAVHMKAAALPRQGVHVILPLSTIAPGQVYAPNYLPGERVVLIRHPHGGTFEIPELVVNNSNAEGRRHLGPLARDAIGIHHTVAERLSGADFDGDTVLVIPNNRGDVTVTAALEGLRNFDPRASYPKHEGMKPMRNTQTEMGKISNLITDMTIRNAPVADIARAIRHSMVVIDAEKHELNHTLSYNDNNIKQLKEKYQSGGASTLISRAGAKARVPRRTPRPMKRGGPVDPLTGRRVYEETGEINYRTGKPRLQKVKRLALEPDARALMSTTTGTPMERLYAGHSNRLKALANEARLKALNTPPSKYSPSAKKTYAREVESLNAKLSLVYANKPRERQAQIIANANIKAVRDHNPNMDEDTLRKVRFQALNEARARTGADKTDIIITQPEWDAIQAGAISDSRLQEILRSADMDTVRDLATPRDQPAMTTAMTSRARQMFELGYTRSQVAAQLGVSVSTLDVATSE